METKTEINFTGVVGVDLKAKIPVDFLKSVIAINHKLENQNTVEEVAELFFHTQFEEGNTSLEVMYEDEIRENIEEYFYENKLLDDINAVNEKLDKLSEDGFIEIEGRVHGKISFKQPYQVFEDYKSGKVTYDEVAEDVERLITREKTTADVVYRDNLESIVLETFGEMK